MVSDERSGEPVRTKVCLSEGVRRYGQLLTRIRHRIEDEEARTVASYLDLSLSNYYAKRSGERPLQYGDIIRLVERYGSEEDRKDFRLYLRLRDGLFTWLETSPIPLKEWAKIVGQKNVKALTYRGEQPEAWEPGELATIGAFIDNLGTV